MLRSLVSFAIMSALLFLPAGTLAWPQAWGFLALFHLCGLALWLWLRKADPALLQERQASPLEATQAPRDRAMMVAILVVFALWLPLMAFDVRFHWSHVSMAWQAVGAMLIVIAYAGWAWVLAFNSFASTQIKLQPERGQVAVADGPYAFVRHPMYGFVVPLMVGVPLMLGSLWGLAILVPAIVLMDARARGEEALMMDGLAGYRAYAARVHHRMVPGLW
jgi:protein-S-isoprenylcysteine O-methyltransferase Ste14